MSLVLVVAASLCAFFFVFFLLQYGFPLFISGGAAYRKHIITASSDHLDFLDDSIGAERLFFLSVIFTAGCIIVFTALLRHWAGILIGLPVGYLAPKLYLNILVRQRRSLFAKQLPEAANFLGNALKAGQSLLQAIESASEEMEPPTRDEFGHLLKRHRMGESLQVCLERMDRRMQNADFSMMVTATLVCMQTGGNLAEMYERLAATVRGRMSMQGKIKSLTSQGKMQGVVVGLLPVFLLLILQVLNPRSMDLFFHSFAGSALLSLGIILELLGLFFIRKIVSIDV